MRSLAVTALTLLLGACGHSQDGATPELQRVELARATTGPALPAIHVNGTLMLKNQVPLSFKVGGIIARFQVEAGDRVQAGQVLAELQRTEVDAGLKQASELAAKAERDNRRAQNLFADQVITREQAEDANTQAAIARASLAAARFNAGHAVIRSLGPGMVLYRLAEAGQLVQAGTPILEIGDESHGWIVRASLADRDMVQVKVADPVRVQMDAYPGRTIEGRVSQIARAADARTGTFDLEVSVDVKVLPHPAAGLLARLTISPGSSGQTLVHVPVESLIEGDRQRAWVFVYDASSRRVRRREVEVAFIDRDDDVALRSGVTTGEMLVTAGLAYLRDGQAVQAGGS